MAQQTGDIMSDLLNRTAAIQVIVERAAHIPGIQPKEHMDAWRLDVGIDDRNALALLDHAARQIGGQVGFACPASVRVNGNDCRHYSRYSFLLLVVHSVIPGKTVGADLSCTS